MAGAVRKAAQPERIAETIAPVTRRFENARHEVERIVAGLVGRGRLTWEEGARLREDVGGVLRDSLSDVVVRVVIGANGRVTECSVAQSSGFTRLDERACQVALRRWRYNPAQMAGFLSC